MNCQSKVLFVLCAITVTCISAQGIDHVLADPYPEHAYPAKGDSFTQKITPPQKALPIDDYLIELAKAHEANFIADVTSIPKEEIVQPFPATSMAKFYHWEPKFHLTILDLTQQSGMSLLTYDPSTFVFWKEPDAVQLAEQWVKETETDSAEKLPSVLDLYSIVTKDKDLLADDLSGDFPKEGKVVDIPLQELPVAQRDEVLTTIKKLFISNEIFNRVWFSEAFWDTATIRLTTGNSTNKTGSVLQVMGNYHQIQIGDSLPGLELSKEPSAEPVSKN